MTRDEFILDQLESETRLYKALFVVLVIATAGAVATGVAAVVVGKPEGLLVFLSGAAGFAVNAFAMLSQSKSYATAREELGDNPVGLNKWHDDYSKDTMRVLAAIQRPTKTYLQQGIAYGVCGIMMLVGGVFLIVVLLNDDPEPVLLALSALLAAGGLLVCLLAVKAFRSWSVAKQLDALGEY